MSEASAFLEERRKRTDIRFRDVQRRVVQLEPILADTATVYVTGSYGRGEASAYSDLDAFILSDTDVEKRPTLNSVDQIRVRKALVDAVEAEGLPPFTDDAIYLKLHSIDDMIEKLGGPEDDYANLFTARMLLLLESRVLIGKAMYERAIGLVLAEYWRDFEEHEDTFLPIYLTNDLIRYWKVLCLNYEANTRNASNPNKRRLTNYKLKHSRLLTCYSAILYFCHLLRSRPVITKEDALAMTNLSPTQRLTAVANDEPSNALVEEIIGLYVDFLKSTEATKAELLARFDDQMYRSLRRESGQNLGDLVFRLLKHVGEETKLFRYLVV